jgi:D-sedoheptulose 7-phosphate isomerase
MKIEEVEKALQEIDPIQIEAFTDLIDSKDNIIVIGNGGSNAIASHISQDYTKALKKKALTFSDPSRLTCYINDYGMEKAYEQFVKEFAEPDTLVVLISSSGNSQNIINAAKYCVDHGLQLVTLTGFDHSNKLNEYSDLAEISFWVDSKCYGVVECVHQIILHTPC